MVRRGEGPAALCGKRCGTKPAGGQSRPPLRKRYKECGASPGGRGRTPPLRRVTSSAEEESPRHGFAVPAPLGKGAKGTGMRIATTSDIGHWFRNDRGFYKGCGARSAGGQRRPPLHFCCKLQKARLSGVESLAFPFFIPFIPPRRWPCRLYRSYSSPAWPRSRRGRACSAPARPRPRWQCCG